MNTADGITGRAAPDFRFETWLANVDAGDGLSLVSIDEPIVYLYNFQSWCPGCHSHGFPTMKAVKNHVETTGRAHLVKFVAVQTVFEGHDSNTEQAALESVKRHELADIALGHDSGSPPTIMEDYRTGGTPWTVIVGPGSDRIVLADGFQIDAPTAIELIDSQLAQISAPDGTGRSKPDVEEETVTNAPDKDLCERLTRQQYKVTQKGGTERAFSGEYWKTKTPGVYHCIVCDAPLFESDVKYDSGTGWPSFSDEITNGRVARVEDRDHGMLRTEAQCASCAAHLGHVFPDRPTSTGERYCMNSASLNLAPAERDES